MKDVQLKIISSHTETANSLLGRSHTVVFIQVYTVEVKLPHRTLLTEHRYSEFRALYQSVGLI